MDKSFIFVEILNNIRSDLNAGGLPQHIDLQNQPHFFWRSNDHSYRTRQRPGGYPASLADLHRVMRQDGLAKFEHYFDWQQFSHELLLIFDGDQASRSVCFQNLQSLVLVAAKEQIAWKQRKQRANGTASGLGNLPVHWQKIGYFSIDQLTGQGLFIS